MRVVSAIALVSLSLSRLFADQKDEWIKAYEAYKKPEAIGGAAKTTKEGLEIRFPIGTKTFKNDTTSFESWSHVDYIRRVKALDAYLITVSGGESLVYLIVGKDRIDTLPNFPVFNSTMKYLFVYGNDRIENCDINDLVIYRVGKTGLTKIKSIHDSLGTPWFAKWKGPSEVTVISEKESGSGKMDTTVVGVKPDEAGK